MKQLVKIFFIIAITSPLFFGCKKFLNIVPDERPQEIDAFRSTLSAKGYLYSCYGWLPAPRHETSSIDLLTSDEVTTAFEHETFAKFPRGEYTASSPVISYWNDLYKGIRQCYIMLANVDKVPEISAADVSYFKAEANFLIGYYHFLLIRMYGPVIIADQQFDVNMPSANYPNRSTYDSCVAFCVNKLDESAKTLPVSWVGTEDYGRATSVAAKAIKARMLLYAASPLFNGGGGTTTSFYTNFVGSSGKQLISTSFDKEKWKKAADAALDAIQAAQAAGFMLYQNSSFASTKPSNPIEKDLRYTIIDRGSKEIIWSDTRPESPYSIENKSTPFLSTGGSWNGVAPTLTMVEQFYTINGLPIDKDPNFDYAHRYTMVKGKLGNTLTLNLNREPRFNAWICYHNSPYEIIRGTNDSIIAGFRKNDNCGMQGRSNNYAPTGYLNKKAVSTILSQTQFQAPSYKYAWPISRLAELYLDYAEALIEYGQDFPTAKKYIDMVRTRAGIPTIDAAWGAIGGANNQTTLRSIVRQERTIELYLENHRFWDLRRWMIADQYLNQKAKGMNIYGVTDADFFQITEVSFPRKFVSPRHYLMPIPQAEVDKNDNLVQNPGY